MIIKSMCDLCGVKDCELKGAEVSDCSEVKLTEKGRKAVIEQVRYALYFNGTKKLPTRNMGELARLYDLNHAYIRLLLSGVDKLAPGKYLSAFVDFILKAQ